MAIRLRTSASFSFDEGLAIRAEGLSKVYHPDAKRIHETPVSLSDRLLRRRTADAEDVEDEDEVLEDEEEYEDGDVRAEVEAPTEFAWGLRGATFDLPRGEAIAVVGAPGSGKSTLLDLLAGVAPPSAGRVTVRGRIWPPLTYLTTFMQPGVTVKQNAVIAAKVANVPAKLVLRNLPALYELLEISLATELRATGNRTRAVALAAGIAVEPDVMLIDSPAIFGGPEFERAAIAALSSLRDNGTTILVEEPDHELIDALCDRVVWLDACRLRSVGSKDDLLPEYVASSVAGKFPQLAWQHEKTPLRSFSEAVAIVSASAENDAAEPVEVVGSDDMLVLHVALELAEAPTGVRVGLALTDDEGARIWIEQPDAHTLQTAGLHDVYAHVEARQLPAGTYTGHVETIVSRNRADSTIGRAAMFGVVVRGTPAPPAEGWQRCSAEWRFSDPIRG